MSRLALALALLLLPTFGTGPAAAAVTVSHHHYHHHAPGWCNRPPSSRWTPREVRCATRRVFAPTGRVEAALSVEWCESNDDAYEVNASSGAAGAWQVIPRFHPDAPNVFQVVRITRWVKHITRGGWDWTPWVCQPDARRLLP